MRKALPFFLIVSVIAGAALFGLVLLGAKALESEAGIGALVAGSIAGFLVSTCGWLVVLRSIDDPQRMIVWFGAGMLTKLVLIGIAVLVLTVALGYRLDDVLGAFAAVFLLLGFVQLALAIKSFGGLMAGVPKPAQESPDGPSSEAAGKPTS